MRRDGRAQDVEGREGRRNKLRSRTSRRADGYGNLDGVARGDRLRRVSDDRKLGENE